MVFPLSTADTRSTRLGVDQAGISSHVGAANVLNADLPPNGKIFGLNPGSVRLLAAMSVLAMLAAIAFTILGVESLPTLSGGEDGDFDIFYSVARLAAEGRITEAYDVDALVAAQEEFGGPVHRMTWTYPPPYNALLAPLSGLSADTAYLVFAGASMALFLFALGKLAGPYHGLALAGALPAVLFSLRTGQNGCLTAAILAFACLWILRRDECRGGVLLWLLIIKPHVGLGLGLWCLTRARWRILLATALTGVCASIFTTAFLGIEVWSSFLSATVEAGARLRDGEYPAFRMTSVYSTVASLGFTHQAALTLHLVGTLFGAVAVGYAALRLSLRSGLAIALFATPLFSPYFYDYDLALYATAFALILPELDAARRRPVVIPAIFLAWVAGGTGPLQNTRGAAAGLVDAVSFAGPAALSLVILLLIVSAFSERDAG